MRPSLKNAYLETYTQKELEYLLTIYSTDIGNSIMSKSDLFSNNFEKFINKDLSIFREKFDLIQKEYDDTFGEYIQDVQI